MSCRSQPVPLGFVLAYVGIVLSKSNAMGIVLATGVSFQVKPAYLACAMDTPAAEHAIFEHISFEYTYAQTADRKLRRSCPNGTPMGFVKRFVLGNQWNPNGYRFGVLNWEVSF